MSIEELEAAAMELPPEERERLGEKLLSSVEVALQYEKEWADEADRRVKELREGDVEPEDGDEFIRAALERLE
jgi:putative addiction module component (TIGR02574 family)